MVIAVTHPSRRKMKAEMAPQAPNPVVVERTVRVAVPPDRLWGLVADTDRLNQAVGLPAVRYRYEEGTSGRRRLIGAMRLYGIPLEWEEKPYEWIRPVWHQVERVFTSGLVRSYRFGVRLAPWQAGTEVTVFGRFVPRYAAARPAVRLIGGSQIRAYARWIERNASAAPATVAMVAIGRPDADEANAQRIARAIAGRLEPEQRPVLEALVSTLLTGAEREVVGMRPFAWADREGVPRRQALRVFLEATVGGLLDMEWALLCPHCRGRPSGAGLLKELGSDAECTACARKFAVEIDRSVEARFTVTRAVRDAQDRMFCRGSPMRTPFIVAQLLVPPGDGLTVTERLPVGAYRLRLAGRDLPLFVRTWQERGTADASGPAGVPGAQVIVGGDGPLGIRHGEATEELCSIEVVEWEDQAATAAFVATLPVYQRLFAADVLAPGQEIGVRRLVFMFSDLKGSTALYQAIGDARAFAVVREHFAVFDRIIGERKGTMVKTVGDAVMAVFPSAADAIAATREAHAAMPDRVHLRIGLHAGPALAVQLNGRNDFFGTTVNLASRLEHLAGPGETIVSEDVAAEAGGFDPASGERVNLKGFDDAIQVHRLPASRAAAA